MGDPSSKVGGSESGDDPSVTSVAGPSVTRERMPEIERGMVLAGRYQVEAIIGKGGSGVVLRAFDRTAQTVVAVKVLKQELVHDERWSKRFSRELRLGRPIRHPNVCRIFDIGEGDGYRFLTMELATGGTLRDLVKRGEPLRPLAERMADAAAAIAGLAAIHEAGIVHRDVKPDNMLRMGDGRLVLSDFGLATDLPSAAAVTVMVGTPHYMAPEVRAGEPATTRSDVWSLGVALYEIFFGKRPERRSSMSSEGMSKPPAPLTSTPLERAMLALCERCLAENVTERPADAAVVARLFETAQSSPRRFARGRQAALAVLALILVVVGTIAARGLRKVRATATNAATMTSPRVVPTGEPADFNKSAKTVVELPGRVHCFTLLNSKTALLVWGTPRRAEEVDIVTGDRRPSRFSPETYATGCPEPSPKGNALLFTSQNSAGAVEIRMSTSRDGTDSKAITPGSEPAWLSTGEDFVYNLDIMHPAIFTLSTMSFALLLDPGEGSYQRIAEKASSATTAAVAVVTTTSPTDWALTIYAGPAFDQRRTLVLPGIRRVTFDASTDDLFATYDSAQSPSTLAKLNWRTGQAQNVGRVPGATIAGMHPSPAGLLLLARHRSSDVWLYETSGRRRLTSDGQNTSAAMSVGGDFLIGKRLANGNLQIWKRQRDGKERPVTAGPMDAMPDYSSDGRWWTYADYARNSVMVCSSENDTCRQLREEKLVPTWPRFSPDGKRIAYVSQLNTPRVVVVSLSDGSAKHLGPADPQCPVIWSSDNSLWDFAGVAGHQNWSERDATTGARTAANEIAVNDPAPDGASCWPRQPSKDSPLFRRLRVEEVENSRILRLAPGSVR
jgi:serine/threonine-protein kinase